MYNTAAPFDDDDVVGSSSRPFKRYGLASIPAPKLIMTLGDGSDDRRSAVDVVFVVVAVADDETIQSSMYRVRNAIASTPFWIV
jgi:hypothetical protein